LSVVVMAFFMSAISSIRPEGSARNMDCSDCWP